MSSFIKIEALLIFATELGLQVTEVKVIKIHLHYQKQCDHSVCLFWLKMKKKIF